jgi:cell wall-associated NlpC family hydrolase
MKHWYVVFLFASLAKVTTAHADCFADAANYQHVNPQILRAIAWQESHFRPDATHRNANGSIDYGMMQINSIHLRRLSQFGISHEQLMDPCASVYIAAWHLREKILKYGNTWEAVGSYHSETPLERDDYARRIRAIVERSSANVSPQPGEYSPASTAQPTASGDLPEDRKDVIRKAAALIGIPYRWGGNTPASGFDCSGLVRYVMKYSANILLPRTAAEMSREGVSLTRAELAPGDLVFFNTLGHAHSHVGIYVGQFLFVNAPSAGGTVRVDRLTDAYWSTRLDGIRRVMGQPQVAQSAQGAPLPVASRMEAGVSIGNEHLKWPSFPAEGGKDPITEAIARSDVWISRHSAN